MNSSSPRGLLDGPYADVRDMVREWLSRAGNAAAVDLPREERREPLEVLVDCQDHVVVAAARAWVDLVVLESFAGAVERCEDAETRALLDRLCSLYALWTVEQERGFYQEHGRLGAACSKAVIKAVNALCAELRPDVGMLVEAFGVPEPALADARPVAAVTP
jgi:acyl-CoA oxidase